MNLQQSEISDIIKSALRNGELKVDIAESVDWNKVYEVFHYHRITPLVSNILDKLQIDETVLKRWREENLKFHRYNAIAYSVQQEICDALEGQVPYVILKGTAVAVYYPVPQNRTCGDIDVLVAAESFDKAVDILKSKGFEFPGNDPSLRHTAARKSGIRIELHVYFGNNQGSAIDKKISGALNASVVAHIDKFSFRMLPDFENGLVILEHLEHHILAGLGIRQTLDFIMYVDRVLDDEFWDTKFKSAAEDLHLDTLAKTIARIGQIYFDIGESAKWCRDADLDLCEKVFTMIFEFGHTNPSLKALNKGRGGIVKRLKYEQRSGLLNWNAAKKHKALRPFAWIYGGMRHVYLLANDKNARNRFTSDIKESRSQLELAKRLGIYETE